MRHLPDDVNSLLFSVCVSILEHMAAGAYGAAIRTRGVAYDLGIRRTERVEGLAVVSVGGISTGGSGKTPMTIHFARKLLARGLATAVVSRGYGGSWERSGGVVSAGTGRVLAAWEEAGDEAFMIAARCPNALVVVGADRVAAARRARSLGARVAVLDSGFQHRRLARDLDVVVLSADDLFDDRLIPQGHLREPFSAMSRADLVAFEAAVLDGGRSAMLPRRSLVFRLVPQEIVRHGGSSVAGLDVLRDQRAVLVAGIARPERFGRTAARLGVRPVASLWFPDHHRYTTADRRRIGETAVRLRADLVLTTEKDLPRLGPIPRVEVAALRVGVVIERGAELLDSVLEGAT